MGIGNNWDKSKNHDLDLDHDFSHIRYLFFEAMIGGEALRSKGGTGKGEGASLNLKSQGTFRLWLE